MSIRQEPKHRPIQPWLQASPSRTSEETGLCYREYAPSAELEGIFIGVWTLTGCNHRKQPHRYHVVPDACSDLIFDLGVGEGFIFGLIRKKCAYEEKRSKK